MQVTEKDSTTTMSWGSHSLGQVQLAYSQCDEVGNFFPVAQPATGDYAGDAIEIAGAAELENGLHMSPLRGTLTCVREDTVLPFPVPRFPDGSAALVGVPPQTPSRSAAGREQHLVKQRGREKNQEHKSQGGVFHLSNGYPVETDAFVSSSFNRGEEAAGVAGQ